MQPIIRSHVYNEHIMFTSHFCSDIFLVKWHLRSVVVIVQALYFSSNVCPKTGIVFVNNEFLFRSCFVQTFLSRLLIDVLLFWSGFYLNVVIVQTLFLFRRYCSDVVLVQTLLFRRCSCSDVVFAQILFYSDVVFIWMVLLFWHSSSIDVISVQVLFLVSIVLSDIVYL